MTPTEIKQEIHRAIDQLPEDNLSDILNCIKEMQNQAEVGTRFLIHLKKITVEDRELLERIAG